MTARAAGDAGETLVELLVAVVILGLAFVAILGGILVSVETSTLHRRQAQSQIALRAWAEQIAGGAYSDCATTAGFGAPTATLPSGFTAAVGAVQYWNGTAFVASCAGDTGIQRVTLRMTVAASLYPGFVQTLDVVVRKPCVSSC